jgi:hypothetical protein
VPATGSQRPLQQSARVAHEVPGPLQIPGSRHVPPSQRTEQQSVAAAHVVPSGRQFGGTGLHVSTSTSVLASLPALAASGMSLVRPTTMSSRPHAAKARKKRIEDWTRVLVDIVIS